VVKVGDTVQAISRSGDVDVRFAVEARLPRVANTTSPPRFWRGPSLRDASAYSALPEPADFLRRNAAAEWLDQRLQ
jgi:hypothetical protein